MGAADMEPPAVMPREPAAAAVDSAAPAPRRFRGRASSGLAGGETPASDPLALAARAAPRQAFTRIVRQQIPQEILDDPELKVAMASLPANYNLEIPKTIWRIRQAGARRVALQFPEGLLMYACTIADILERFTGAQCIVMGDVAYGACCVDDYSAAALGAEFLVHYGHSCLVPVDVTSVPAMYVFVEIGIDVAHLIETIRFNFESGSKLVIAGTIQFASAIHAAKSALINDFPALIVPQSKPLSPGEVLGCTAPKLDGSTDTIVFVADGRFHLEAMMIANPTVPAYRYDPYSKVMTLEVYDHVGMKAARKKAIERAASARRWGVVLGTLGRQGNPRVMKHFLSRLEERQMEYTVVLMSELSPEKMAGFELAIDAWVQIACPRLSIDWGEAFGKTPLLNPYEAEVALGFAKGWWERDGAIRSRVGAKEGGAEQDCAGGADRVAVHRSGRADCVAGDVTRESGKPCMVEGNVMRRESECGETGGGGGCCAREGGGDHPDNPCCAGAQESGVHSSFGVKEVDEEGPYPMDYYARDGGAWSSSYGLNGSASNKGRIGVRGFSRRSGGGGNSEKQDAGGGVDVATAGSSLHDQGQADSSSSSLRADQ